MIPHESSTPATAAALPSPKQPGTVQALLDRVAAALGIAVAFPLLFLIAAAIVLNDGFPVFYRHRRIGQAGRLFEMMKFRSMRVGVPGSRITGGSDPRVTRVGGLLRKYKLDEIPQLWNVVRGEMSLVGPRPELPAFVDLGDAVWQAVLRLKPGITSFATLVYRDEEAILAGREDVEQHYRQHVLPVKLGLDLDYLAVRSPWLDLKILLLTGKYSLWPSGFDPDRVCKEILGHQR